MKGRWESNINVWFPLCIPRNETVQPPYFLNRTIMFCLLIPILVYQREIYIFPGSVCLFCCREICGSILWIYKSLTDTWMWKLGLRPHSPKKGIHKWDFRCSAHIKDTFWSTWGTSILPPLKETTLTAPFVRIGFCPQPSPSLPVINTREMLLV